MTSEYLTGVAEGMTRSRCSECHYTSTYPRQHCAQCGGLSLTSESLADRGTVYAVTVVRAHPDPTFMALAPYAVAMVDLDGGGRVMTRLTTTHADLVRIGDRVEVGAPPPAEEADNRDGVDGKSTFLVGTIDGKQAH